MKAFVTGATGFVGPHLCAHLRACGDDVVAAEDALDVVDRDAVLQKIEDVRPDVVYHLAAQSEVAASWRDPTTTLRVNVEGTQHVLDAARAVGVQRVLVVGSAEEYGRVDATDLPLREDAPLRPITPYGASKVAASYVALQAWIGRGLETIRVRTFTHTGPGQADRFVIPALARRIAEAERNDDDAIMAGALDPVRDVSDVRDIVRAYRLLMEHGEPGAVYNVCSGTGVTIDDIAKRLLAHAQRALRIDTDPNLLRPTEVPVQIGDPAKLQQRTGWQPTFSLDDTVGAVLDEARANASGALTVEPAE